MHLKENIIFEFFGLKSLYMYKWEVKLNFKSPQNNNINLMPLKLHDI